MSQQEVIAVLEGHKEGLPFKEIHKQLNLSDGTVYSNLAGLMRWGDVKKEIDPNTRKVIYRLSKYEVGA